ncbi:hypothetical protein GS597_07690 [Synechococcales cyanobacterium C]|uniref:Uncharacterized protein n=1 Tax=Petrachloros mirabilis ULC683 TaxID=2781853 RepID=A0A8K2A6X5_9CYAN|nr:hypothetical protein [Petrachloros mirabilis]NCJ06394.1 hypothetical protein [Petrachloros mirabilis ULC683]
MLITLLAGLLLAIAFQFLLTNLGIALGISVLSFRPASKSTQSQAALDADSDNSGWDGLVPVISLATGLGILLTLNGVLAGACFLAVKLSFAPTPLMGAILGLLIWAAYGLLLFWLSSVAVGSVIDLALSSVTVGLRRLKTAMQQLFKGSEPDPDIDLSQRVQEEVASALADNTLQQDLRAALAALKTANPQPLQSMPETTAQAEPPPAKQTHEDGETALIQSGENRLDARRPMLRLNESSSSDSSMWAEGKDWVKSRLAALDVPQLLSQALNQALAQVDLSDWDLEQLWQQVLPTEPSQVAENKSLTYLEVADYLQQAHTWTLHPEVLETEFPALLYDPEADPQWIAEQLVGLSRDTYVELLQGRGDLTDTQIDSLADVLSELQASVQDRLPPGDSPPQSADVTALSEPLINYLRYTNLNKLSEAGVAQKVEDLKAEFALKDLPPLALEPLAAILKRRQGLSRRRRQSLLTQLEQSWAADTAAPQTHPITAALPTIDWSAITLEDLKPDLLKLFEDPSQGVSVVGQRIAQLDWEPLVKQLQNQVDPDQARQVTQWLQQRVAIALRQSRRWLRGARHNLSEVQTQLQRYLRYQSKTRLTPAAIQEDVAALLSAGAANFSQDSLTAQTKTLTAEIFEGLSTRADLTRTEAEAVAAQVQTAIETMVDSWKSKPENLPPLLKEGQQATPQIESAPDLATIKETLSAQLQLPSLESLKQSVGNLLAQSSMPNLENLSLTALRDPLVNLAQEAQSTVLEMGDQLSETVTQDLMAHIAATRDRCLAQLEQMQADLQAQVDGVRHQVQARAESARKVAAIAAWWLFFTALTTGATAALAGFYAVRGLPLVSG